MSKMRTHELLPVICNKMGRAITATAAKMNRMR